MKQRLPYACVAAAALCAVVASGCHADPADAQSKPSLDGVWSTIRATDTYGAPLGEAASAYVLDFYLDADPEVFPGVEGTIIHSRRCAPNQTGCTPEVVVNEFTDLEFTTRVDPNRPKYKPEYWDKVQNLDYDSNFVDPSLVDPCGPRGVPRMGPPRKIIQTANEVVFFYTDEFRLIPIDGRAHDPNALPTFRGDAVGHWEADTLVVDTRSYNDSTWLARGGYFHSYEMRVIERLRRDGDTLNYQVTVEDPEVLLEPWTMNAVRLKLNPDPNATISEGLPCHNYDSDTMISRVRH